MRVSSVPLPRIQAQPQAPGRIAPLTQDASASQSAAAGYPSFMPFCAQAFSAARTRRVPVFLLIGDMPEAFSDSSLAMQLNERTVPVHLPAGLRPDVELLCQRAGEITSGEGALPLCALLLDDTRPFLAAPLPPPGYPLDASRLYVWLAQADRRFTQNLTGMSGQAAQIIRSFRADALQKPYTPQDAAHDLSRALSAIEDKSSGGFGGIKSPFVCALRFLQHAGSRGDRQAHAMLSRALDAMLASALYDPLDGAFFRATLTDDWRVFVPEKPLVLNAMLALALLDSGRRSEAVRTLDFIISAFSLPGGALAPSLLAPKETYAFTPEQVCAALGSENGLRACRLLGLLHQHTDEEPAVTPSRFSPVPDQPTGRSFSAGNRPALYPTLSDALTPEDSAFLRRILAQLLRARAARAPQRPSSPVVSEHMALAAAVLAHCGRKLGEPRYTQAAQRAITCLISQPPACGGACPLPASGLPASPLHAQATCGASAALSLALLTLGSGEGMEEYARSGLRLLSGALHAFVREDGLVMHTQKDPAAFFPRVPAVFDGELPSPAALLVRCLRIADELCPQAHYNDAIETIWQAAAPAARKQPLALLSLIDAAAAK